MLKGVVIGFVLAVIILGGGLYYYFAAGMAPVATADPPMPFERMLSHMALNAHIGKQATGNPPWRLTRPHTLPARRFTSNTVRCVMGCQASPLPTIRPPCSRPTAVISWQRGDRRSRIRELLEDGQRDSPDRNAGI